MFISNKFPRLLAKREIIVMLFMFFGHTRRYVPTIVCYPARLQGDVCCYMLCCFIARLKTSHPCVVPMLCVLFSTQLFYHRQIGFILLVFIVALVRRDKQGFGCRVRCQHPVKRA